MTATIASTSDLRSGPRNLRNGPPLGKRRQGIRKTAAGEWLHGTIRSGPPAQLPVGDRGGVITRSSHRLALLHGGTYDSAASVSTSAPGRRRLSARAMAQAR